MAGPDIDDASGRRALRPGPDGDPPPVTPGAGPLSAVSAWVDGHAVLTLSGDLDMTTASDVRAAARGCLRQSPPYLCLDLSAVSFCDVAGLRALRLVRCDAIAAGAGFRLLRPSPHVARILTLMDAGDLLSATDAGQPVAGQP